MKKTKTQAITQQQIEASVSELLSRLGFEEVKITVEVDKEEVIAVDLETPEGGILIGYHGEILGALQLILSLIFYRQSGQWQKVSLDIGGYWQRRRQQLEQMTQETASRVKQSGKSEEMPFLSSRERRIIHEILAESEEAATESIGEGRERRLVISPK